MYSCCIASSAMLYLYFLHPEIKASATLLTNARRQFSSDGCLSRCMTRASARRVSCTHPRRDPRRTHAVYCNARSQVLSFFSPFSRIMTRLLSSFSTPYRGFPVPGARSSLRGAA